MKNFQSQTKKKKKNSTKRCHRLSDSSYWERTLINDEKYPFCLLHTGKTSCGYLWFLLTQEFPRPRPTLTSPTLTSPLISYTFKVKHNEKAMNNTQKQKTLNNNDKKTKNKEQNKQHCRALRLQRRNQQRWNKNQHHPRHHSSIHRY